MNFRISFSSSMTTPIGIFIGISLNFVDDVMIFSLANPEHDMVLLSIYLGLLICPSIRFYDFSSIQLDTIQQQKTWTIRPQKDMEEP